MNDVLSLFSYVYWVSGNGEVFYQISPIFFNVKCPLTIRLQKNQENSCLTYKDQLTSVVVKDSIVSLDLSARTETQI